MPLEFGIVCLPAGKRRGIYKTRARRRCFAGNGADLSAFSADICCGPSPGEDRGWLMKWHREDDISRRIATIPGVGPIGSPMLSMKAPPPETFRSGRDFGGMAGADTQGSFNWRAAEARRHHKGRRFWRLRSTLIAGATALFCGMSDRAVISPHHGSPRCWSGSRRNWSRWPWPTSLPASLSA